MTAVMREALARRSASIMMNISIKLWFVGGLVDFTRYTSSPRTFSSIFTNVSPSGKELTVQAPNSTPMEAQIALARGWLAVPLNILTIEFAQKNKTTSAGGSIHGTLATRFSLARGNFPRRNFVPITRVRAGRLWPWA